MTNMFVQDLTATEFNELIVKARDAGTKDFYVAEAIDDGFEEFCNDIDINLEDYEYDYYSGQLGKLHQAYTEGLVSCQHTPDIQSKQTSLSYVRTVRMEIRNAMSHLTNNGRVDSTHLRKIEDLVSKLEESLV